MQIKLKIALAAAGFALASYPVFAFDMPPDGTKNFSAPSEVPSYFSNETVPESGRVNHEATFDSQEVPESSSAPDVSHAATATGRYGRHAMAYGSARHAHGRYYGHGGTAHFARTGTNHNTTKPGYSASHGGASKHARIGTRQHAAIMLPTTA
jgi:hypothetical protein